jgi:hypothetical protein
MGSINSPKVFSFLFKAEQLISINALHHVCVSYIRVMFATAQPHQ